MEGQTFISPGSGDGHFTYAVSFLWDTSQETSLQLNFLWYFVCIRRLFNIMVNVHTIIFSTFINF